MKKKKYKRKGFLSGYDPNGSYTGNVLESNNVPIQDADDL